MKEQAATVKANLKLIEAASWRKMYTEEVTKASKLRKTVKALSKEKENRTSATTGFVRGVGTTLALYIILKLLIN